MLIIPFIADYPDATILITDRYGQTIFSSVKENKMIWDGKYLNRSVPTGTYWYYLNLGNGSERSGWIMVKNGDK